ncbi:MAG TPA: MBL fold metallo-hydrolase [Candidatus Limnocylindrales bacterium]|nr:MBL fold metallo-hydrolase [Candidatus Limnocylindrales bacterium]
MTPSSHPERQRGRSSYVTIDPAMTHQTAKLVFWGVRGSTPTLERDTWRYGGNTPCLELTTPGGTPFILDCGTGLRMLGNQWTSAGGNTGVDAHVLVTHYHWDHIQGIPFFHPFFEARNKFHFYSFQSKHLGPNSLRQVLEAQLAKPYFPVDVSMMTAERDFHEISGGEKWEINGTKITAAWLNHPQGCLGYRLDTAVGSVVYATDNEPGPAEFDSGLRRLATGADVLIYDAQYSPEQLASTNKGWGHSSWLEGVKIARDAKVRNLVLFHHDPDSSDKKVDGFLSAARQEFPATWAATEGMSITLSERGVQVALRGSRIGPRRRLRFTATVSGQSEDGSPFEEKATVRDLSLQGAYLCLKSRPRLQSEMRVVIEAAGDRDRSSMLSLRGTVVHCDPGREKSDNGVGVVFIEEGESVPPSNYRTGDLSR